MSEHAPTERIGGPGGSHEKPPGARKSRAARPRPEESKSDKRTGLSGGGGERDSHHTHDPGLKGGRS